MVVKRRTQEVWVTGRGLVDLKPVIKYGTAYVVVIPIHWVSLFCNPEDVRVTLEYLEDEPGFIIRPFKGPIPDVPHTLRLPGL